MERKNDVIINPDRYFISIDPTEIDGDLVSDPSILFAHREEPLTAYIIFYIVIALEIYCNTAWIKQIESFADEIVVYINILLIPLLVFLSSFYFSMIVNSVFNIIIPPGWITQNSRYYSHTKDKIIRYQLPHITIQIPVYKESFSKTIKPTIESVLRACDEYRRTNRGSANIFINDDGLMLLSQRERDERITYYKSRKEISYIARPPENRTGRFKKASNMNFCLRQLFKVIRMSERDKVNDHNIVLQKYADEYGFLAGTVDRLMIGKYILILDSDSRLDPTCFIYLINEMESDKTLGFVQVTTNPLKVLNNYWEDCVSHFTEHIYSISFAYCTSNGNPAPFVGHNAMLRTEAMEISSWIKDGSQYFWAEDKVSEDFDMSLRMQIKGFTGRYIGYDLGFMEGVSLSVLEEINRFCKYSYGVNEIFLNPISLWTKVGILSPNIKRFMMSNQVPIYTKFNIIAYMGSYYACAMGPIITIIQYFAYTYSLYWREVLSNSLYVIITCVILYSVLLPLSNIVVKAKLGSKDGICKIIYKELVTTIFLSIFFSGLGFHILRSIFNHLFGLEMSWSTTEKNPDIIKDSTRWKEIKHTLSSLRLMYSISITVLIVATILWWYIDIRDVSAVLPLYILFSTHIMMPLLLNPIITGFTCIRI